MPRRLPDDVVHRILVRLSASEPVPDIAKAIGVAHETVYRMQRNVELWGVPYPLPTVKLGRPRSLLPYQEEVIRCNISALDIIANSLTYRDCWSF
jgi:transposase